MAWKNVNVWSKNLTKTETIINRQQEQKLTFLLDTVLVSVWKDSIELICLPNVTNVDKVDCYVKMIMPL